MLGPVLDPTPTPGLDCALEQPVDPVLNPSGSSTGSRKFDAGICMELGSCPGMLLLWRVLGRILGWVLVSILEKFLLWRGLERILRWIMGSLLGRSRLCRPLEDSGAHSGL